MWIWMWTPKVHEIIYIIIIWILLFQGFHENRVLEILVCIFLQDFSSLFFCDWKYICLHQWTVGYNLLFSFLFLSLSVFVWLFFIQKILKSNESTPTEVPLSHTKHCSWNASSVVPPFILWLCDITLQTICFLTAVLQRKNWFSTATLLLSVALGQACVSWPITEDWVLCVSDRKCAKCVFWALKHVNLF